MFTTVGKTQKPESVNGPLLPQPVVNVTRAPEPLPGKPKHLPSFPHSLWPEPHPSPLPHCSSFSLCPSNYLRMCNILMPHPSSRDPDSVSLTRGPGTCIFHKKPEGLNLSGSLTTYGRNTEPPLYLAIGPPGCSQAWFWTLEDTVLSGRTPFCPVCPLLASQLTLSMGSWIPLPCVIQILVSLPCISL